MSEHELPGPNHLLLWACEILHAFIRNPELHLEQLPHFDDEDHLLILNTKNLVIGTFDYESRTVPVTVMPTMEFEAALWLLAFYTKRQHRFWDRSGFYSFELKLPIPRSAKRNWFPDAEWVYRQVWKIFTQEARILTRRARKMIVAQPKRSGGRR